MLAEGTVIRLTAADDGPDLLGVLIGSEGTLGIVTEATVALRPIAPVTRSLMGSLTTAHDAAETVAAIIQTGTVPAAVEWLDRTGIAGLRQFTDDEPTPSTIRRDGRELPGLPRTLVHPRSVGPGCRRAGSQLLTFKSLWFIPSRDCAMVPLRSEVTIGGGPVLECCGLT